MAEINVINTDASDANTLLDGPSLTPSESRDAENTLIDTEGDDLEVRAGKKDDLVKTGSGDDFIAAGRGSDIINSGAGNDVIEAWNHTIDAEDMSGDNRFDDAVDEGLTVARDKDLDALGHCVDDVIVAGAGSDYVEGGGNNDIIYGDRSAGAQYGENLIDNGDFESVNIDDLDVDNGSWGLTAAGGQVSSDSWYANEGSKIELQNTTNGGVPGDKYGNDSGDIANGQFLELDSHNANSNATVSNDFMVSSDGIYQLDFSYAFRNQGSDTTTAPFTVRILNDAGVVFEKSFNDPSTVDNDWDLYSADLKLSAGDYTLQFIADGEQDTYGALIDNVSIKEVLHNDVLIGDGTPRDGSDTDGTSTAGNDLVRGGKGNDVLIGDSFDPLYYDESAGSFQLDDPTDPNLSNDKSNLTAYDRDGNILPDGDIVTSGNAKDGNDGFGVVGNAESGVVGQIGFGYSDNPDDEGGSEMLSVCLDEHTMVAKVGISNLFENEGNGGVDEVGMWVALRDGIKVAEGYFTSGDVQEVLDRDHVPNDAQVVDINLMERITTMVSF
ncbi:alkaline phosphatase [Vibrio maritimus]|uniref:Alkaline phosphatase n=1 Tax=Vibrio maritimus TaxID=990268 RepID=A0A090RSS3_9VIBR|nr:alkaline phosphatase [Vibrio maritimus]